MLDNLDDLIEEAKKVKEAAFKSAEFLLQEKLASEQKDNYLKLLFESKETECEETESKETECEETESKETDCETKPKMAKSKDSEKVILTDEIDVTDEELFESLEAMYNLSESTISEDNKSKKLLKEEDGDTSDEVLEDETEEANEEVSNEEVPQDDDEELEFDLEGLDDMESEPEQNNESDSSSSGVLDNPNEPTEDVEQIDVTKFPFAYNRNAFHKNGKENKNKKSKIKLAPQYEEDSPLRGTELDEGDQEYGDNEDLLNYDEDSEVVSENIVKVPSHLMLEYMEKDLLQESKIEKLENLVNILENKLKNKDDIISKYVKQLEESNRFLAESIKVQYKYKAMSDPSLNERQKRVICEQIDKHENVDTIGKVFDTLINSVSVGKSQKESLSELGSKATKSTIFLREQREKYENEKDLFSLRLKQLAGIE